MMKYLNLLLLLGLSIFMFSCNDDDDPANPKDANPIYFSSGEDLTLEGVAEIENMQFNFDHSANEVRLVVQFTPVASGNTVPVALVYDVTQKITSSTRSDDYKYTIQVDSGSIYSQNLKIAAGCLDTTVDPGFGAGSTNSDVVLEDFVQWDESAGKYYIDTSDLIAFIFGVVDPGFTLPPGIDPDYSKFPKIWQSSGSIKGCSELPTLFY